MSAYYVTYRYYIEVLTYNGEDMSDKSSCLAIHDNGQVDIQLNYFNNTRDTDI